MRRVLALLLAAGCNEPVGPPEHLGGVIKVDDLRGEVSVGTAFAATGDQGQLAAYLSSDPAATCAGVAEWLGSAGTADPADVLEGGTCNLYIPVSGYDGSFTAEDDAIAAAGVSIDCYLGEGEFAAEEGSSYAWTGTRWQGRPTAYRFAFAQDGSGHELDVEMSAYSGFYPEEGAGQPVAATGDVSGTIFAEDCPALGDALGW